jgi:outer membrane protein assembly factor BamB
MKSLTAGFSLFLCITSLCPAEWNQWRGPSRNGDIQPSEWPAGLDESRLQRVWRQEIGQGYPGPVLSANRVFTVETRDKKYEIVRAFDRATGKQAWSLQWEGSMKVPFFSARNGSWVRSTPAFDGECLYVGGMRDVLVCIDAEKGTERWRVDFMERFDAPLPDFGFVCSPLVLENAVYVQAGACFAKLDKTSGETIWTTLEDLGGMYGGAFSSPISATICGAPQIIVQTRNDLCAVAPSTGKVLWMQPVKSFRGMNILTPIVMGNQVFTSSYGGGSYLFDIQRESEMYSVKGLWLDRKSQGYMSSPVVIDGMIYHHRRDKRFCCLDPSAQSERWKTSERLGDYWSMVANGAKILALNDNSELFLIQADPEKFNLLDRRKVAEEETWGHLAVDGDQVFIRELNAITAFRWREPF